mgnify:CR=1 FL=1
MQKFRNHLLLIIAISLMSCSNRNTGGYAVQTVSMADPDATEETVALYKNLLDHQTVAMMFGHQDDLAYGIGWWGGEFNSDVQLVTGKYPAVFGWDAGEIGQERNIDSILFSDMQRWMIEVFERGGINTLSWHLDNPVTGGDSWDVTRAVESILPGGELHDQFRTTLDQLADFLNGLKTAQGVFVPVIFRPWHEHTGSWFWWGAGNCTMEEYVALYRFTVEYLRDVKGLHHLLYAYSPDRFRGEKEYLERYPGDAYVDMLGYDDYHSFNRKSSIKEGLENLRIVGRLAAARNKPFALTETGLETIPVPEWWTEHVLGPVKADSIARNLSYMLVWRNGRPDHYYAPYPGQVSEKEFLKFENDSFTWFLEDLPAMYE